MFFDVIIDPIYALFHIIFFCFYAGNHLFLLLYLLIRFYAELSDRPSAHDAVRLAFLVDNQLKLKSPPIRVTHRSVLSPRTPIGK